MRIDFSVISLVLSVGAVLGPVLMFAAMWKLSSVFTSQSQFNEYKVAAHNDRAEMKQEFRERMGHVEKRLDHIEENTTELLQRTACKREV